MPKSDDYKSIAFQFARHLMNPEGRSLPTWGREGMDLLVRLRDMDPKAFDREVKGKLPKGKTDAR